MWKGHFIHQGDFLKRTDAQQRKRENTAVYKTRDCIEVQLPDCLNLQPEAEGSVKVRPSFYTPAFQMSSYGCVCHVQHGLACKLLGFWPAST